MNKMVRSILIVMVVGIALGSAGLVYAQSSTPQGTNPGSGLAYGMGGGRGPRGGMMQANAGTQDGVLHDELIAIYAVQLGISVDDLNARLADGETLSQIALSTGLTFEEFRSMLKDARTQAIAKAVENGTLTQEQAEWMNQRGAGLTNGSGRMRGAGQGQAVNPDCPYRQVTP